MISGLLILNDGSIQAIGLPDFEALVHILEEALPQIKIRADETKRENFNRLASELGVAIAEKS